MGVTIIKQVNNIVTVDCRAVISDVSFVNDQTLLTE